MKSIFITGVDTDIGKTFVSLGLCLKLSEEGKKTGYFKPFQSGAIKKDGKLYAPDIEEIKKYSSRVSCSYSYLLEGEVSPFLASLLNNVRFDFKKVKQDLYNFSKNIDYVIIEGAGGLYCPISKGVLFCDLIKELNQEIIIVTTPHLGRLNHTLMTVECAKLNNIKIKGIIINKIEKNMTQSETNFIKELKTFYKGEILAQIPCFKNPSKQEIIKCFKNIV